MTDEKDGKTAGTKQAWSVFYLTMPIHKRDSQNGKFNLQLMYIFYYNTVTTA